MNHTNRIGIVGCSFLFYTCLMQCSDVAPQPEKPLVVIIPSYNNERWVEKNLSSVFEQKYSNYRVIYVADCPTDNTVSEVRRIVADYHQPDRFTLLVNEERCGAMANWYTTIHSCDDDEIVVQLDGDDWLYNDQVLAYINKLYSEHDIWLTYGQFIEYPSNVIGYEYSKQFSQNVIAYNAFRKIEQLPMSHLRTCKAWLFKAIKLEDVLYQEQFYPMTCDKLMMACMVEMAAYHHYCVPDVLYVYNNNNALNDHRVNMQQQHSLAWHILGLPPYEQLSEPLYVDRCDENDKVTAVILCNDHYKAKAILDSMKQAVHNLRSIVLLMPTGAADFILQQTDISSAIISYEKNQLLHSLIECLQKLDSRYILLAVDAITVDHEIDITACMRMLKTTQTNIFYLGLGNQEGARIRYQKKLPQINRDHTIAAWHAGRKNGSWTIPAAQMTIWQKNTLLQALETAEVSDSYALQEKLDEWLADNNVVGLMYNDNPIKEWDW